MPRHFQCLVVEVISNGFDDDHGELTKAEKGYAVILSHGDHPDWWRVLARFANRDRAVMYAYLENECYEPDEPDRIGDRSLEPPEDVVAEPATRLAPRTQNGLGQAITQALAEETAAVVQPANVPPANAEPRHWALRPPEPLSDRICERPGCGNPIPARRARRPKTKYCSAECQQLVAKERIEETKAHKGEKGRPPIDLAGRKFGALTAIEITDRVGGPGRHRYWLCRCDCGAEKEIRGDALLSGYHLSCGCGRTAASKERAERQERDADGRFLAPEGQTTAEHSEQKKWCEWCGEDIPAEKAHKENVKFCSPGCMIASQNERQKAKSFEGQPFNSIRIATKEPATQDIITDAEAVEFLEKNARAVIRVMDGGKFHLNGLEVDRIDLVRRVNRIRADQNLQPVKITLTSH